MTSSEPLRLYLATALGAPLGQSARQWAESEQRVALVGESIDRLSAARLQSAQPDLLISAAHEHFIGREIRAIPKLGTVGLHPSLLPLYRGSHPLWWALRNRETEAGLTLFHLVEQVDAGNVLWQERIAIRSGDTFGTLYARTAALVPAALSWLVDQVELESSIPVGEPQNEAAATWYRAPGLAPRVIMKVRWGIRSLIRGGAGDATSVG